MKKAGFALATATAIIVVGCSTTTVQEVGTVSVVSTYNPEVVIPRNGTFGWDKRQMFSKPSSLHPELADHIVSSALGDSLKSNGFVLADGTDPDLLLSYTGVVNGKVTGKELNLRLPVMPRGEVAGESQVYDKGTLVVEILDNNSKELVWRGAIQVDAKENLSNEQRTQRMIEAVKMLMSDFSKGR